MNPSMLHMSPATTRFGSAKQYKISGQRGEGDANMKATQQSVAKFMETAVEKVQGADPQTPNHAIAALATFQPISKTEYSGFIELAVPDAIDNIVFPNLQQFGFEEVKHTENQTPKTMHAWYTQSAVPFKPTGERAYHERLFYSTQPEYSKTNEWYDMSTLDQPASAAGKPASASQASGLPDMSTLGQASAMTGKPASTGDSPEMNMDAIMAMLGAGAPEASSSASSASDATNAQAAPTTGMSSMGMDMGMGMPLADLKAQAASNTQTAPLQNPFTPTTEGQSLFDNPSANTPAAQPEDSFASMSDQQLLQLLSGLGGGMAGGSKPTNGMPAGMIPAGMLAPAQNNAASAIPPTLGASPLGNEQLFNMGTPASIPYPTESSDASRWTPQQAPPMGMIPPQAMPAYADAGSMNMGAVGGAASKLNFSA